MENEKTNLGRQVTYGASYQFTMLILLSAYCSFNIYVFVFGINYLSITYLDSKARIDNVQPILSRKYYWLKMPRSFYLFSFMHGKLFT